MYTKLKERVLLANLQLKQAGLVKLTWGNVSEFDEELGVVAIKPSGVSYETMVIDDIVVVNLKAEAVEGELKPSSDLLTHLEVYKKYPQIKGITHTHSTYATAWAQAKKPIPYLGTTHADHFKDNIVVARELSKVEITTDYELNTGIAICDTLKMQSINPLHTPAILVPSHAPFIFGKNAIDSVKNAIVLEEVAKMAKFTYDINSECEPASVNLLEKHFSRKHGKNKYYGQ